jgi:hypothetical protein
VRRMEAILDETTEVDWQRRAPSPTATSPEPYSIRSCVRISTGTPRASPTIGICRRVCVLRAAGRRRSRGLARLR